MRQFFLFAVLLGVLETLPFPANMIRAQDNAMSIEQAVSILQNNNNAIKIAQAEIEMADARNRQLNAAWYPSIGINGGYMRFSNNISVKTDIGETIGSLVENILPQLQQIVSSIGGVSLSVPLLNKEIATFDAAAIWPIITGGKRIYASRIGKEQQETAMLMHSIAINTQMALMLDAYYTLKLSDAAIVMAKENLQYMEKLMKNSRRLKDEGFINKAEFLVVEVAQQDGIRELESAIQNREVATRALNAILGTDYGSITPTGNFFVIDSIPSVGYLQNEILHNNAQLKVLASVENILINKEKIAKSNYIPNVALFARRNLYSSNIPKNLMPRTTVGAAMQWNIFNGFNREAQIKEGALQIGQLQYTIAQTEENLITSATALRSRLTDALYSIKTLEQTIALATELLREREKSFAEGMCTSTDVVEARTSLTKANTALNLAQWEYCTSLANILALCSNTHKFIELHNGYQQ